MNKKIPTSHREPGQHSYLSSRLHLPDLRGSPREAPRVGLLAYGLTRLPFPGLATQWANEAGHDADYSGESVRDLHPLPYYAVYGTQRCYMSNIITLDFETVKSGWANGRELLATLTDNPLRITAIGVII